jgi:hypothetical protein
MTAEEELQKGISEHIAYLGIVDAVSSGFRETLRHNCG